MVLKALTDEKAWEPGVTPVWIQGAAQKKLLTMLAGAITGSSSSHSTAVKDARAPQHVKTNP